MAISRRVSGGILFMAAALAVAGAGCSGPKEADAATAGETRGSRRGDAGADGPKRTDMPPADYVRYRCSTCSCSVFTGEGPDCNRPGCRHHWSSHVRSFK